MFVGRTLSSRTLLLADSAAPRSYALGRVLLHPLSEIGRAPIRQDCIETSAKSEVVTMTSRQLAGEERLQSTATILIMAEEHRRYDGHWLRPYDLRAPHPVARCSYRWTGRCSHI